SAVTSCGGPTPWLVPPPLVRSSVPCTPRTSISAVVDFTQIVTFRGTCTSNSARPASSSVRTCASPAPKNRPIRGSSRAETASVSTSQPSTRSLPSGLVMRTVPPESSGQRFSSRIPPSPPPPPPWPPCPAARPASNASTRLSQAVVLVTPECTSALRQARGPPQQLHLLAGRRGHELAELGIGRSRVSCQRSPRFRDRSVDDLQVPLEQRN